jgi:hypothetical protein
MIVHQHTASKCNGMAERIIKTLKHGLNVLSITSKHIKDWDKHLPKILLGYPCGIQASTKSSPHILLTRRTLGNF